jgi:hypothetical protein
MRGKSEADPSLIATVGYYRVHRTDVGEYQIWNRSALEQGPFDSLQEAMITAGTSALGGRPMSFGVEADRPPPCEDGILNMGPAELP